MDNDTTNGSEKGKRLGGFGGLIAILVAIVAGVLVGVLYGQSMWMAADLPKEAWEKLDRTKDQKIELAAKAEGDAATAEQTAAQADEDAAAAEADGNDTVAATRRAEADRLRGEAERLRSEAGRLREHVPIIEKRMARTEKLEQQAAADKKAGRDWLARLVWQLTKFAGDMFLQVLFMLVIPLVVTSMISGVTSLGDVRKLGRLGGWTLGYYFSTCAVAVLIGIVLVLVIRPGESADDTFSYTPPNVQGKQDTGVLDTLLDVFRGKKEGGGMFPKNLFEAASGTNVLGLLVFALLFGGALTTLGEKGKVAIAFFHGANEAVMKLVHLVMFVAPIGIYGLVATKIAENGGGEAFGEELGRLTFYATTVLVGLGIHVVFLAALLPLLAKRNPFAYTYNMLRSLLTAMSTASSSATLPVTFECVEQKNGVSNRSAGFVLPLGATINMDGTALYEAVAVIFIAQSIGLELSLAQLIVIFLTATLAAIGAAGIPEAGLVTMVIVLTAAGVPTTGIGTILAIDWFLDRMRTTVNVYGDSVGAAIVDTNVVQKTG
jgi:Na+/H+-dicarboxylate symporter